MKQVPYLACTRCGLVVMQGSTHDGSPLCRDCWHDDEIVVKMDLIFVPTPKPPTRHT